MSVSMPSLARRAAAFASIVLLAVLATLAGCGRSDLNDYLLSLDGGLEASADAPPDVVDGGPCNATTCPAGCCDSAGRCQAGSAVTQCGTAGESCHDCQAEGFQFCDATKHACGSTQPSCGPGNCSGCCDGTTCFAGSDPNECGAAGAACQHCQSAGLACKGNQCVQAGCGPQNCHGCCFGDVCQTGTDQTACGANGQQCQNCAGMKETCVASGGGGQCHMLPSCGPTNCKGCCQGNVCLVGTSDSACGARGQACQNCATSGESCSGQLCVPVLPPTCNAQNCPGCCDFSGTCQPGFVNTQCGQNGATCVDCTAQQPPSTCDVNVMPRTCSSQQTQCPSPYPACPANLETPTPTIQNVCTAIDLQAAAAACSAGAHSPGCWAFFSYEAARNPACGTCLSTFDYDFSELTGLLECVAPFVDASCNHDTACLVDCTDQSCAMCNGSAATSQCQNQVRSGQCSSYYQGAQCIGPAFFGPGSFCNPNHYQGNFGNWLQGVGKYYCAQ